MKTVEELKAYKAKYYQEHKEVWAKSEAKDPERAKARKKRYVEQNPEKRRESILKYDSTHKEEAKSYYMANQDHIKSRVKANAIRHRENFLLMYGNACECCGETQKEFLTIDHIHGQKGNSVKDRGTDAYRKATESYRPDLYRVFCMNCNFATRFDGSVCPHQQ